MDYRQTLDLDKLMEEEFYSAQEPVKANKELLYSLKYLKIRYYKKLKTCWKVKKHPREF